MSSRPAVPRLLTGALSCLLLLAAALLPAAATVGAATASTTCPVISGEGTYSLCYLDIAAPSSVRTGFAFTVQVRVTTDLSKTTVATSDPCGSKAPITLNLSGATYSNTQTVNASAGIATFSFTIPIDVANAGTYDLYASVGGGGASTAIATSCGSYIYVPDSTSLMAVFIPADKPIAPCPADTNCVQTTSGSGTQATLIGETGSTWSPKAAQYFGPAGADSCATGPIDANGVLRYTFAPALATISNPSPSTTPVIILALDMSQVLKGIAQFNICWSQPTPFVPLGGGTPVTVGDLPNCKNRDQVAPCVLSRTSGQHNVGFFSILATAGDPGTYAH